MPQVVMALAIDMSGEPLKPGRGLSYEYDNNLVYVPTVIMASETREQFIHHITMLAGKTWDLAMSMNAERKADDEDTV